MIPRNTAVVLLVAACTGGAGWARSADWIPIPIVSETQNRLGIPGGEGFQMTQHFSWSPSNPDVVYMVVDTSQVWKSTDGGRSWESKRDGFVNIGGNSLLVDPRNEKIVFVASDGGLYRTTNGGDRWEFLKIETADNKQGIPPDARSVGDRFGGFGAPGQQRVRGNGLQIAIDPESFDGSRCRTIYAGTARGLVKSADGGDTWRSLGLQGLSFREMRLKPGGGPNVLYVAAICEPDQGTCGLFKVVDGLDSVSIEPIGDLPTWPRSIALVPRGTDESDVLYAAAGEAGLFKSVDGGSSFRRLAGGLPQQAYFNSVSVSPANHDILYARPHNALDSIYYSHDGDDSWRPAADVDVGRISVLGRVFPGSPIQIEPHPLKEMEAFAMIFDTVRRTEDGGRTWSYSSSGFLGGRLGGGKDSIHFDPEKPERMIWFFVDWGPFITEDGGATFRKFSARGRTSAGGAVSVQHPEIMVTPIGYDSTAYQNQTLTRTTDGGQTWNKIEGTADKYLFIAFHPQNDDYVYAGTSRGSRISRDRGATWDFLPDKSIRAVEPDNGNTVYALEGRELVRSDDRGETWATLGTAPFQNAHEVTVAPTHPQRIYFAASSGVYLFEEGTFAEIGRAGGIATQNFGQYGNSCNVTNLVIDPNRPHIVYAGLRRPAHGGHHREFIYRSADHGKTWASLRGNLAPYSSVWAMAVSPHDSTLFLCTGHGIFKLPGGMTKDERGGLPTGS